MSILSAAFLSAMSLSSSRVGMLFIALLALILMAFLVRGLNFLLFYTETKTKCIVVFCLLVIMLVVWLTADFAIVR